MVFASFMSDEWTFVPTAAPTRHNYGSMKAPPVPTFKNRNNINDKQTKIVIPSNGDVVKSDSSMASVREAGKSKNYWHQGKASHKNSIYTGEE